MTEFEPYEKPGVKDYLDRPLTGAERLWIYRLRKKGIPLKVKTRGRPSLNGKPMTQKERNARRNPESRSGPSGAYPFPTAKDAEPIFIGIDGESVEGKAIPYEQTERYRENQCIERAWQAYLARKTEEEIWRHFKRVIMRDFGGIRLHGWNRNDWVNVVPPICGATGRELKLISSSGTCPATIPTSA
jgi:hypothetical protein